jgi:hypothetical protein
MIPIPLILLGLRTANHVVRNIGYMFERRPSELEIARTNLEEAVRRIRSANRWAKIYGIIAVLSGLYAVMVFSACWFLISFIAAMIMIIQFARRSSATSDWNVWHLRCKSLEKEMSVRRS